MKRLFIASLLVILSGCVNSEFRFERIDAGQSSTLPLKFISMSGVRDGESVKAEAQFKEGQDSAQVDIQVRLGPPVQFVSGSYRANIEGRSSQGLVSCDSLSFLGGQAAAPSVGGVFVLKDSTNHPVYRITMPPTPIQHGNINQF